MPLRALSAVAALSTAACGAAMPRDAQPVAPELRLEGVQFRVYRGDALRAHGESETASLRRDSSVVRARKLAAVLPQRGLPVRITAPAGEGSLASRTFEATGGVEVARGDDAARTERARYEPAPAGSGEGLVVGDEPVAVTGKRYLLTGAGFTLDPADQELVVRGGARLFAGGQVTR